MITNATEAADWVSVLNKVKANAVLLATLTAGEIAILDTFKVEAEKENQLLNP